MKMLISASFILICLLPAVFLPADSKAQHRKIPRVGHVSTGSASAPGPLVDAFRQGLRELGYADGKNIVIDYRYAEGKENRMPGLVNELVHSNVDVPVVPTGVAARFAKHARKDAAAVL